MPSHRFFRPTRHALVVGDAVRGVDAEVRVAGGGQDARKTPRPAVDAQVDVGASPEVVAGGVDPVQLERVAPAQILREAEVELVGVGLLDAGRGRVARYRRRRVDELVRRQRLAHVEERSVGVLDAVPVVVQVDLAEGRLRSHDREQDVGVRVREVVVAPVAAADEALAVALDVIAESQPWGDVVLVLLGRLAEVLEARARAGQPRRLEHAGLGSRLQLREDDVGVLVEGEAGRQVVAHAQVEHQLVVHAPGVLDVEGVLLVRDLRDAAAAGAADRAVERMFEIGEFRLRRPGACTAGSGRSRT